MAVPQHSAPLRRLLTGSVLLVVFLLLNAAVVVPAIHALWHADHHCDETECVVLAVAQGNLESPEAVMPPQRPLAMARLTEVVPPSVPVLPHAGSPPAERGPPA